ncbi:hypothetical protein MACK_003358 [Theileria orientalis]|uniref:Uncharacterized protein n=1 Tax=Theileria orientalis TaxID=68886 RepID=A0A976SIQ8_THEOR|nr:hypothetical protein MACK_003358 [Theileria orientalis]
MSLNLELHEKAIKFAERICGPNCERCKLALQENLEIRARLYCDSLKRAREESDDSEIYYDAIEFDPDYLPVDFFKSSYKGPSNSTPSEVNNSNTKQSDNANKPRSSNDPGTPELLISPSIEPPAKRKNQNTLGLTKKDAQDLLDAIIRRADRYQKRRKKMNYAKDPKKVKPVKYELPDYIRNQDWSTLNSINYLESIKYLKRPGDDKQVAQEQAKTVETETPAEGLANIQNNIASQTDVGPSPTLEEGVVQDISRQKEYQQLSQDQPKDLEVKEPSAIFGSLDSICYLFHKSKEQEEVKEKVQELPKDDVGTEESEQIDDSTSEQEPQEQFDLLETTLTENEPEFSGKVAQQVSVLEPKKDNLIDISDKINLPIPHGNPLFAPKQDDSSISEPKTDGANIFGQSFTAGQTTSVAPPPIIFGSTQHTQLQQPQQPQLQALARHHYGSHLCLTHSGVNSSGVGADAEGDEDGEVTNDTDNSINIYNLINYI